MPHAPAPFRRLLARPLGAVPLTVLVPASVALGVALAVPGVAVLSGFEGTAFRRPAVVADHAPPSIESRPGLAPVEPRRVVARAARVAFASGSERRAPRASPASGLTSASAPEASIGPGPIAEAGDVTPKPAPAGFPPIPEPPFTASLPSEPAATPEPAPTLPPPSSRIRTVREPRRASPALQRASAATGAARRGHAGTIASPVPPARTGTHLASTVLRERMSAQDELRRAPAYAEISPPAGASPAVRAYRWRPDGGDIHPSGARIVRVP